MSLIERFRSPVQVFRANVDELQACGLPQALARSIHSGCSFDDAAGQHSRLLEGGAAMIPFTDPRYPERLKSIYDPPLVLFAKGDVELLASLSIGVVGTRRATPYGLAAAEKLAGDLAAAGLCIVSGMARGIDTAAHKAALGVGGQTIAVLGHGVDQLYPAENKRLCETIARQGLLVSEFPMGTPPYPQNFPVRNRIISGLSLGILVVEGAQYSGSAITARLAMEQGREVFAVPGNITSKWSWGPNLLIKQGAKLVQDWQDVVAELPAEYRRQLARRGQLQLDELGQGVPAATDVDDLQTLSKIEQRVLATLPPDQLMQLDSLTAALPDISPSEIIAALFNLEMCGLVRQKAGQTFQRVWQAH